MWCRSSSVPDSAIMSRHVSRSSALAPVRAKAIGRPAGVANRCRRSPQPPEKPTPHQTTPGRYPRWAAQAPTRGALPTDHQPSHKVPLRGCLSPGSCHGPPGSRDVSAPDLGHPQPPNSGPHPRSHPLELLIQVDLTCEPAPEMRTHGWATTNCSLRCPAMLHGGSRKASAIPLSNTRNGDCRTAERSSSWASGRGAGSVRSTGCRWGWRRRRLRGGSSQGRCGGRRRRGPDRPVGRAAKPDAGRRLD